MYGTYKYPAQEDLEGGSRLDLYPGITFQENIDRWNFIRKVYGILSVQLLLTTAVATVVSFLNPAISRLLINTSIGFYFYIFVVFSALILMCLLYYYSQRHPTNFILLFLFTACMSFAVGSTCAFTDAKGIWEAVVLTTVVVLSLTLYTFWAAIRGHNFSYLWLTLFSAAIVLLLFASIQAFVPFGRTPAMIYGALASILFSCHLIFETDRLIKRYDYDDYVWASVVLYIDIMYIFLSMLSFFRARGARPFK